MPPDTLRLFIAIELSDQLRQALAALQEDLQRQLPPKVVRWVRPAAIHLTLKFLGDTPAGQVEAIAQGMIAAAAGFSPFAITAAGLGCFPNPRRARVLWTGLPDAPKGLAGLQRATDLHMARLGFEREKRPFSPHLTLGRVNKKVSTAGRQALEQMLATVEVGRLGQVSVAEVILFRSQLKPSGAVYTALARAPLAAD